MKLLSAGASPFVSKCVMAALHAGLDVAVENVDANGQAPELLAANPLGKIPALVLDDGTVLYDSRMITRYFDRISGGKLVHAEPLKAELMEAHCDGLSDCAVAGIYEQRMRPEEKVHQPWLDRQWGKVERGLDNLPGGLPATGDSLDVGGIALAATLGYLDLRYKGEWEGGRGALVAWFAQFKTAHAKLAKALPHA